jgi:hypothetical protein
MEMRLVILVTQGALREDSERGNSDRVLIADRGVEQDLRADSTILRRGCDRADSLASLERIAAVNAPPSSLTPRPEVEE